MSIDELQRDQILPPLADPNVRAGSTPGGAGGGHRVLVDDLQAWPWSSCPITRLRSARSLCSTIIAFLGGDVPRVRATAVADRLLADFGACACLGVVALLGLAAYFPALRACSFHAAHVRRSPATGRPLSSFSGRASSSRPGRYRQNGVPYFPRPAHLDGWSSGASAVCRPSARRRFWVACFHVLTSFGIFQITRKISHDDRMAGIAAAVYAVSPSFPFFDGMYAYESFAIPLLVWSVRGRGGDGDLRSGGEPASGLAGHPPGRSA